MSALLKNSIIKDAYMAMGIASVYLISSVVVFLVVVFFTIKSRLQSARGNEVHTTGRKASANGFLAMHIRLMLSNVFLPLSVLVSVVTYIHGVKKAGLAIADAYTNMGILSVKLLLPIILIMIIFSEYIAKSSA